MPVDSAACGSRVVFGFIMLQSPAGAIMNEFFFLTRFERCVMQSVLFRCCMVDVRGGSHRLPTEDAVDAR